MPRPRLKQSKAKRQRSKAMTRKRLEQQVASLKGTACSSGDILNLPGLRAISYTETDNDIIIFAESLTEPAEVCPCGGAYQKWGFAKPTYYLDLPIRSKRVRVYFDRQRYRCLECETTVTQPIPGVEDNRRLTTRLLHYIEKESLSIFRTHADIADEVGYSEQSVRDISAAYGERLENERRIDTPPWISLDEIHVGGQARCVITDPIGRKIIDILPTNSQEELELRLLRLPDRHSIRLVTMDMWTPYKGGVRLLLPGSIVITDRYHVHELLNGAIKDVLAIEREGLTYTEQRKRVRGKNLLLASRYHLEAEDEKRRKAEEEAKKAGRACADEKEPYLIELRDKWLEDMPDLAVAYWLKEKFSDILQLRDRQEAESRMDLWLIEVHEFIESLRSKYRDDPDNPKVKKWKPPFSNVLTTFKSWRAEILNYIDCKDSYARTITNFFAEHANGKIKRANALCYGLDFETLRTKVVHGGLMVERRPPHPLSETKERPRAERPRRGMEVNPDSNLERLRRAREARDDTRNLRPKPQTNPGWATRFLWMPLTPSLMVPPGDAEVREDAHITPREDVIQHPTADTRKETETVALAPLPPEAAFNAPELKAGAGGEVPVSGKPVRKSGRKGPKFAPNQLTMF